MGGGGGGRRSLGDIRALEQRAKAALQGGKRNVFISFAMEDLDEVNLLRAHAKNEKSDIEFNDYSVREPYDSERAEYIRQKITERIERASVTVVYLSESTPQSKWVKWEVEKSLSLGKRVVGVFASDKPPSQLPAWVSEKKIGLVPWKNLADELSK
ncbi:TIR domain-containing protein [Hydrogenophaga borbori]|uniref:TIR domain-containing protein n=1 Tax=Hydrogenophaga borbori TaxID=2294117 RepID=UPI00301CF476